MLIYKATHFKRLFKDYWMQSIKCLLKWWAPLTAMGTLPLRRYKRLFTFSHIGMFLEFVEFVLFDSDFMSDLWLIVYKYIGIIVPYQSGLGRNVILVWFLLCLPWITTTWFVLKLFSLELCDFFHWNFVNCFQLFFNHVYSNASTARALEEPSFTCTQWV